MGSDSLHAAAVAKRRNKAVLGAAVHPNALARLHELYPYARITVRHISADVPLNPTKFDDTRTRKEWHTEIEIDLDGHDDAGWAHGYAFCHPDDAFDRKRGITLAFRRALNMARTMYKAAL